MSGGDGCLICPLFSCVCVCVCPWSLRCVVPALSSSCLCLVLFPGSTLSAQSVPTMYPGQLALLAPGGLADSGSSSLLQPLKPSPSSNNLCSAYTSEGALSVPSLCAPTPGRHATVNPGLQQTSRDPPPHNTWNTLHTDRHKCMQLVCLHSPTMRHFSHLFLSFSICVSLCVNSAMANCYILPVYSFTCVSFLPSHLILSYLPLVCLSLSFFCPLSLHCSPLLSFSLSLSSSPLPLSTSLLSSFFLSSSLSSGCVKFSWGSERLAFKPGGRRTRFLSTPCLALCV